MKALLLEINNATQDAGGSLPENIANEYCEKYRAIIAVGEIECPLPEAKAIIDGKKKRGRIKKSKARNLLERLASLCRKHGIAVTTALKMLFKGEMLDFISDNN